MGKRFGWVDSLHADDPDADTVCVTHGGCVAGANGHPAHRVTATPSDGYCQPAPWDAHNTGCNCYGTGDGGHNPGTSYTVPYGGAFFPFPAGRGRDSDTDGQPITHDEPADRDSFASTSDPSAIADRDPRGRHRPGQPQSRPDWNLADKGGG